MQKWHVSLALACGSSIALVNAASGQVVIQVQVQGQPGQIQILPAQVQFQPGGKAAMQMIAPGFNGGNRLAQADAVFVGRVVAFEPMDVEATQTPNGAKAGYRVAVVQVTESIFGLKKDTQQVRVAFIVQGNNGPFNGPGGGIQILPAGQLQPAIQPLPGGGLRRPFPGNFPMQLQMGQDGLFTVNKHHKEAFYLSPTFQNFVNRQNNVGFDNEVKTAKQLSKVMANPVASLKTDDKQDRYTAAAVLIAKYRMPANPTGQPMKTEQVDAEESTLILKALAAGDWTPNRFGGAIPAPYQLFSQLGINQKDGYNPVNLRTAPEIYQAMQKWLDENNGKYRINRMVVDANGKAPAIQPGVNPGDRPLPPVRILPGDPLLPAPVPLLPAPPIRRNN